MQSVYCEIPKLNGFLEPFNAISNLSFIVAAFFLFLYFKKNKIKDSKSYWFLIIALLIGVGSFLWHFYRHNITHLLDVVPIGLFFVSFGYFYASKVFRSKNKAVIFLIVSMMVGCVAWIFPESFIPSFFRNEGYLYLIAGFLLLIPIIESKSISKKYFRKSILVFALFMLALIFRQIDLLICTSMSIGSHFIWHILNGIIIYHAVILLYKY